MLITDVSGAQRLPRAVEKERLMGFYSNHTSKLFSKFEQCNRPIQFEDERNNAIGNTFHCIVVARIVA
eukprot:6847504-Karenia_brevis.AAC.1